MNRTKKNDDYIDIETDTNGWIIKRQGNTRIGIYDKIKQNEDG